MWNLANLEGAAALQARVAVAKGMPIFDHGVSIRLMKKGAGSGLRWRYGIIHLSGEACFIGGSKSSGVEAQSILLPAAALLMFVIQNGCARIVRVAR